MTTRAETALVEIAGIVLEDIGGDKLARIGEICRQALPPDGVATTKLMYARPVSELVRKLLPPPGLVLVEVPPNCALDAATSEVQATLRDLVEQLGGIAGGLLGSASARAALGDIARTLDRVRTLLGQPLDGLTRRDVAREFFLHGVRQRTRVAPGVFADVTEEEERHFDELWKEKTHAR